MRRFAIVAAVAAVLLLAWAVLELRRMNAREEAAAEAAAQKARVDEYKAELQKKMGEIERRVRFEQSLRPRTE